MTANNINIKVKNIYTKKLLPYEIHKHVDEYTMTAILKALQAAYDLGHADGYSAALYDAYSND